MEIKTLAQILAESDNDSASSRVKKDKSARSDKANATAKPKSQEHLRSRSRKIQKNRAAPCTPRPQNRYKSTPPLTTPDDNRHPIQLGEGDLSFDSATADGETTSAPSEPSKKSRRKKGFHPAATYTPKDLDGNPIEPSQTDSDPACPIDATNEPPPNEPTLKSILAELRPASALLSQDGHQQTDASACTSSSDSPDADSEDMSHIPSALKVYLLTPEERHAKKEAIKAESRLRWLAFYYLSRREHARGELKQKLLAKDQDPAKVEALLDEFEEKGYQSDWRTALMLIREGIRKGRGRQRIKQDFYKRKLDMPSNIDELIDMASSESDEFADFIDSDAPEQGVDWLKLAVEARVKKYGAKLPETPKEKARQLRFLQYRGFKSDICFEALKYDLETLVEREG